MQTSAQQDVLARVGEGGQGKLQTDHQHEKHDAQLGEKNHLLVGCDEVQAVRADHDPGKHIAYRRGKPQNRDDADRADGREDDQKRVDKRSISHIRVNGVSCRAMRW